MRVIVNTSPLIALERIGQLHLLKQLYSSVVRPQSVLDEIEAGREHHDISSELVDSDWILTEPDPPEMVLRKELGKGETAAIALAAKTKADLIILDDFAARLVAQGIDLAVTGTLGVLRASHRLGYIEDMKGCLTSLNEAGFYLSQEILKALES